MDPHPTHHHAYEGPRSPQIFILSIPTILSGRCFISIILTNLDRLAKFPLQSYRAAGWHVGYAMAEAS